MNESVLIALGLVLAREAISFFSSRHTRLIDSVERNSLEIASLKAELSGLNESMTSFHKFYEDLDLLRSEIGLLKQLRQTRKHN